MVRSPVNEHETILANPEFEKNRVFSYLWIGFFELITQFRPLLDQLGYRRIMGLTGTGHRVERIPDF
jgi:hypothetical protein